MLVCVALFYPHPIPCATKNRFNYLYIGECIFNRRGHLGIVEDCLREEIALDCVLIAGLQKYLLDRISVLIEYSRGLIGWGVERDLDLDAALGTKDIDALVVCK